jgi:hypothetical protein
VTDPIHPIGPRDRDVEPVQRLNRLPRDGKREQPDENETEDREHASERHADPQPEQWIPPEIDDGNPHVDVRV